MENKKDNLSELEALKADYALLKQSLEKQEATHARMLAEIKSRRISRLNKEMNRRIRMNLSAFPMGLVLLLATDWSNVFAIFVVLWGLVNVYYAVKIKRQLNADGLMTEEVKCATKKIIEYRRFYRNSLVINSIVCLVITLYIFVGIFSKLPYNESIQRIWIVGTVFVIVALVVEVVRYRKHHKLCQELLAQFDEEKNDAGE